MADPKPAPIKLTREALSVARIEVAIESVKQVRASCFLNGQDDPSSSVTIECGFGCWASASEALVHGLEALAREIRTEMTKVGVVIRPTGMIVDATKPQGGRS